MSKKRIWVLAVFIALSMVALVVIQLHWINVASKAKQKQLLQQVSAILNNVVDEAGSGETVSHNLGLPPVAKTNKYFQSGSLISQSTYNTGSIRLLETQQDIFSIPTIDTLSFTKNLRAIVGDSSELLLFNKSLSKTSLGRLGDELNVSSNFPEQRVYVQSVTEKIISIDLPLEQRISLATLDSLVKKELEARGIDTEYKLAVSNDSKEYVMTEEGFDPKETKSIYTQKLFPHDPESAKNFYLNLYIPHQNTVILRSIGPMFVSSIILIIIIVSIFVATLMVIFRQKRMAEIRSDFVSNMTHELKTPIATISLAAQMLEDKNIPIALKNVEHLSKMVREESRRLGHLVEKVLQMAIFDRGTFKLKPKQLDLHQIIKKTIENYALQFQSKGVKVTYEFNANESTVYADEVHITNIISNLIDNAIKYAKESPAINITTLNKNGGIVVSVKDNGIGISKEYQKRIFDQFFRVPTGNIHAVKGFGLGLSYVKKIVEMHEGTVWLQSEQGVGSTFAIQIPVINLNEKK